MSPALSVVADRDVKTVPKTESVAEHIRRLQMEATALANGHIGAFRGKLSELQALASEIADGGPAYHDGVREFARSLAVELEQRAVTLEAIITRRSAP